MNRLELAHDYAKVFLQNHPKSYDNFDDLAAKAVDMADAVLKRLDAVPDHKTEKYSEVLIKNTGLSETAINFLIDNGINTVGYLIALSGDELWKLAKGDFQVVDEINGYITQHLGLEFAKIGRGAFPANYRRIRVEISKAKQIELSEKIKKAVRHVIQMVEEHPNRNGTYEHVFAIGNQKTIGLELESMIEYCEKVFKESGYPSNFTMSFGSNYDWDILEGDLDLKYRIKDAIHTVTISCIML